MVTSCVCRHTCTESHCTHACARMRMHAHAYARACMCTHACACTHSRITHLFVLDADGVAVHRVGAMFHQQLHHVRVSAAVRRLHRCHAGVARHADGGAPSQQHVGDVPQGGLGGVEERRAAALSVDHVDAGAGVEQQTDELRARRADGQVERRQACSTTPGDTATRRHGDTPVSVAGTGEPAGLSQTWA